MKNNFNILVINPGSTSTKIAIYKNENIIIQDTIYHSNKSIAPFKDIIDQYDFRLNLILDFLKKQKFDLTDLDAIVGRGGLLRPLTSGTYKVNKKMLYDLKNAKYGEHASNLGAVLAYNIALNLSIPAYIVDPVVVDEMQEIARISGIPQLPRKSIFHALNQKAVARNAAQDLGKKYEESNMIVVHMGGGISIGIHYQGKVIDVNNALNGEGPFSPERSGTVPVKDLVQLCFSGKYSKNEIIKMIRGKGGIVAYLNTNNVEEVLANIKNGDDKSKIILEAMAYQIAKSIGEGATVLKGKVDAIVLTGGISHSNKVVEMIKDRVSFISLVMVYPGEEEMLSLCQGTLRVLLGKENEKVY